MIRSRPESPALIAGACSTQVYVLTRDTLFLTTPLVSSFLMPLLLLDALIQNTAEHHSVLWLLLQTALPTKQASQSPTLTSQKLATRMRALGRMETRFIMASCRTSP